MLIAVVQPLSLIRKLGTYDTKITAGAWCGIIQVPRVFGPFAYAMVFILTCKLAQRLAKLFRGLRVNMTSNLRLQSALR